MRMEFTDGGAASQFGFQHRLLARHGGAYDQKLAAPAG